MFSRQLAGAGRRPPRRLLEPDQRPTLGDGAFMGAVEELPRAKGLADYRVAYKRNAKGDHVVAVIYMGHARG